MQGNTEQNGLHFPQPKDPMDISIQNKERGRKRERERLGEGERGKEGKLRMITRNLCPSVNNMSHTKIIPSVYHIIIIMIIL